jgi:hypothetical protein
MSVYVYVYFLSVLCVSPKEGVTLHCNMSGVLSVLLHFVSILRTSWWRYMLLQKKLKFLG